MPEANAIMHNRVLDSKRFATDTVDGGRLSMEALTTEGDLLLFEPNAKLATSLPEPITQIHVEKYSGGYKIECKEWILEIYSSGEIEPLLIKLPSYSIFLVWTRALDSMKLNTINSSRQNRYSRPPSPSTSFIAPSPTEFSPPSAAALRGRPFSQNDLIRRRKSAAGSFYSNKSDSAWTSFDYGRRDGDESIPPVPTNPVVMNQLKTAAIRKSSWISFKWLKRT
ncbi:hypothetical protein HK100_011329 [Physocladia obscura]|uniref:Uncharacterized protein n=1 Tax=Physocladia obscura TaxID=109957 RepID=A0AAD5XGW8_9FUNG|nr:hypothetical protein HK100_011329 [Physocladia obscura]